LTFCPYRTPGASGEILSDKGEQTEKKGWGVGSSEGGIGERGVKGPIKGPLRAKLEEKLCKAPRCPFSEKTEKKEEGMDLRLREVLHTEWEG